MGAVKEVKAVTLTRKDFRATVLTILAVLVFAATHQGWNVWLVGDSHRWAAVVITLLGVFTCGQGTREEGSSATRFLTALGVLALPLSALAIVTGSLTWLSLLVLDIVVLWGVSTFRHAFVHHTHEPPKPVSA